MATLTITIPDAQATRVADAFCLAYGWRSVELDGTKAVFVKKAVIAHIKQTVLNVERGQAEAAALAAVTEPVEVTPS